ncbi:hypothetical protein EMPS_09064 [Entomortierella parvispora]|uniref:Major facilitator superfamily (MFS) profile domain-containing protein n=1 Tax=Entomortierella parvispora TaxID=205924 RepID=A0A9P3M082_9FUNG|nr:hypothetical protein EMPS_09064 [Entomortierella parvispora]
MAQDPTTAVVPTPTAEESSSTINDNDVLGNAKQEVTTPESVLSNSTDKSIHDPSPVSTLDKIKTTMAPLLLYVVSTAQFLDIVNGASVSVAIIPIAEGLNFKVSEMIWILNAYTIAFAGLLLVSGRLGDLFGHRRMFLAGLFWFSTWAIVVSFSTSPLMFIIARALQGMGAAGTIPTAMALIATNFPAGPARTRAFSIFAAFGGLGAVTGILLAGGLIASIGWAWIFRVSAIAGYFLFILGFLSIPLTPPKAVKPKVDFLGGITVTLGVTGIVYYISMGVEDGWASPKTLPIFFAGLLLLALFIFIEYRVHQPLMPLRIWKVKSFSSSVVLAFVSMAMMQVLIYYVNLCFQEIYNWTAIQTALGFLVHSLLAIVVFSVLGRVLPRLRLKPLIMTGFLLRCITGLMMAFLTENTPYWAIPFPALIIHVFGIGFSYLPVQITAVRDAANQDQGLVGAIYNTGLQMGAPFGIAILNVIALSTNGNGQGQVRGGPQLMKGYKNAFFGIVAFGILGFFLTLILLPWDKPNAPAKTAAATAAIAELPVETVEAIEAVAEGKGEVDLERGLPAVEKSKFESEVSTISSENILDPTTTKTG